MKDVKLCRRKIIRSITAFLFSFIFAFYSIFSVPMFSINVSAAAMGGSVEAWRFNSNQWVGANSQVATEAEGEWLPLQAKLTDIQGTHPGLAGLVFEVEFTFTKGGARFFDAIRSVQVSQNITVAGNGKLGFPLDDTDVAYPTASGNAWDLSSRAGIESAQNNGSDFWWDSPVGDVNTGFIPIEYGKDKNSNGIVGDIASELPLTQINVPVASDLTDEPDEKTINGVQGFSFDDDNHRFYMTGEQLVALGVSPTANNLVVYFQLHLARTSIWSQGNMKYFADSKDYQGCWIYDQEPYLSADDPTVNNTIEINTCDGAGLSPGASAHVSFGPSTLSANSQVQFPPIGAPTGIISGYKWTDVNNDGKWQPLGVDGIVSSDDEVPLANWPVNIIGYFAGVYIPLKTVYTDATGLYTITMLTNDIKYYVCEDPGSMEMFQTYPQSGSNPSSDTNLSAPAVSGTRAFDIRGNPAVTPVQSPGTNTPATDQEIASYVQYALYSGIPGSNSSIEWARWAWEVKLNYLANEDGTASQTNLNFGNTITPPSVQITKNANKDSVPETGGNVKFTYKISNNGLSAITVTGLTDDKFNVLLDEAETAWVTAGHTAPILLAPNENFSFDYEVFLSSDTLVDFTNIVTVTAQDIRGTITMDTATETVLFTDELPVVDIVKTAAPTFRYEPGGIFNYNLVITNKSTETVTITALTDSNPDAFAALASSIGATMAPGAVISIPYSSTYTAAGVYSNNASVTVRDNEFNTASDSDSETVTVEDVLPIVDIVKSASPVMRPEPGGIFDFTLSITNKSIESVTIESITDTNPEAAAAISGHIGDVLQPNQELLIHYSTTHTEAGSYSNTATVVVYDNELKKATDNDTEVVRVSDELPVVDIEKTASIKMLPEPGGDFPFTLKITNSGVDDFTITAITDTNAAATVAAIAPYIGTKMLPGESITINYSMTYTEAGPYKNTATVIVEDNDGHTSQDTDTETVTVSDIKPIINIQKAASPIFLKQPGGDFHFTVTITNSGPEPVTIKSLTDTNAAGSVAMIPYLNTVIAAGETKVIPYTINYTLAGIYPNTVDITVVDNEGNSVSDSDDETVTVTDGLPAVDIKKSANIISMSEPGGVIKYTLVITNICPEVVTITQLTDTNADATAALAPYIGDELAIGQVVTIEYDSTRTDAGTYSNVAFVQVKDASDNLASDSDNETVTVVDVKPVISIVKTVDTISMTEPGGDFTFKLVITNKSKEDVTISELTDTDPGITALLSTNIGTKLAPGAFITLSYVVNHKETGVFENIAAVAATDNDGNTATDNDTETVSVRDTLPSVSIDKSCITPTLPEPGGVFPYTIVVRNIGVEDFTITAFTDSNPEAKVELDKYIGSTIADGDSITITYNETHTDAGTYPDIAEITVRDNELNFVSKSDNENVTVVDLPPVINIEKTANPITRVEPGGVFNYSLLITNGSAETVTITSLTDTNPEAASALSQYIGTKLSAGASITLTYSVTQNQFGIYPNTATVMVTDNEGNTASDSDSETITVADEVPVVDIRKSATTIALPEPGGVFAFTLVITNAGPEAFTITNLTDTNPEAEAAISSYIGTVLAAGTSITIKYNTTHTEAGVYDNTATVFVSDNESNTATDSDTETVTVRDMLPDINLNKSVDVGVKAEPGGNFNYTILITNNGVEKVTITSLTDTIPEAAAALVPYLNTTINPGAAVTINYTLPFYHAGVYNNTAAVAVVDNEDNIATDNDSEVVAVTDVPPTVSIDKLASELTVTPGQGSIFEFTLVITNTSVEAVTIKSLTDSNAEVNSVLAQYVGTVMNPGESITVSYILSRFDPGEYANTANVTVNDNELNIASDSDTELVVIQETEAIVIVPTGDNSNVDLLLILLGTSALMYALPKKRYSFKKEDES